MTRRTIKDLDEEFSVVKAELTDMKTKMAELLRLCNNIQKSFNTDKVTFKCDVCDEDFDSSNDLKKHIKNSHRSNQEALQCVGCKRDFNEKWKLDAHTKSHCKYSCDICSETFRSEAIKANHIKVAHKKIRLFCHYFNNRKTCPFESECVFLHEEAELCRYGAGCERINCMFKHIVLEFSANENEDEDDEIDEKEDDDQTEDDNDDRDET